MLEPLRELYRVSCHPVSIISGICCLAGLTGASVWLSQDEWKATFVLLLPAMMMIAIWIEHGRVKCRRQRLLPNRLQSKQKQNTHR